MENKKFVVSIMLLVRMMLFVSIAVIGSSFYGSVLSSWQFLSAIFMLIILLDIYDGKIARASKDKKFIFRHRCADGVVDKIGNTVALLGFLSTGRLGQFAFVILTMRELVLLLLGCWAFWSNQREHIKSDYYGKMYYLILVMFVILNFPSNVEGLSAVGNTVFVLVLSLLMFINIGVHVSPFIRKSIESFEGCCRNRLKKINYIN